MKTKVQFVVDVSGSMIRFNGLDRRLERMLETTLMIMQSLPVHRIKRAKEVVLMVTI